MVFGEPDEQVGGDADPGARAHVGVAAGVAPAFLAGQVVVDLPGRERVQVHAVRSVGDAQKFAVDHQREQGGSLGAFR